MTKITSKITNIVKLNDDFIFPSPQSDETSNIIAKIMHQFNIIITVCLIVRFITIRNMPYCSIYHYT